MTLVSADSMRFNLAVHSASVRILARFAAAGSPSFQPDLFIAGISTAPNFPYVSIGESLRTVNQAGGGITAKHIEVSELRDLRKPVLVHVNRGTELPYSTQIFELGCFDDAGVTLVDHWSRSLRLGVAEFRRMFIGIIYLRPDAPTAPGVSQPARAKEIVRLAGLMSPEECARLRLLYDLHGGSTIPPSEIAPIPASGVPEGPAAFGTSLDLDEGHGELVRDLLARAARHCGAHASDMEGLLCRCLAMGERIPSGFDNGVNLQRLTAIHCAFSDGAVLEVTESLTGDRIALHPGDAVIISCADDRARTRWRSEWSAMPRQGVAYLASCWRRFEAANTAPPCERG